MQHKIYILSLSKHSQIKVYAIIVINGFCRLKLVKDHPVGDLPAAPTAVSPLDIGYFRYLYSGVNYLSKYFSGFFGKNRVF